MPLLGGEKPRDEVAERWCVGMREARFNACLTCRSMAHMALAEVVSMVGRGAVKRLG